MGFVGISLMLLLVPILSAAQNTGTCPGSFTDFISETGSCLQFVSTMRSWFDARDECVALGTELVKVDSEVIAEACLELLRNSVWVSWSSVNWIGLNDLLIERDFRWSKGEKLLEPRWGFKTGQQPNRFRDQNCVITDIDVTARNNWQDRSCSHRYSFICQYIPGDTHMKTGYFRLGEVTISNLLDVETIFSSRLFSVVQCAIKCLQMNVCDGYAFNKATSKCSMLKL